MKQLRQKAGTMLNEGHQRFVQALLCIVCALIGFSTLLVGNYSRFGLWRQILFGIALLVLVKMIDNVMINRVLSDAALWPLEYVSTLFGLAITWLVLWISARPALFAHRDKAVAA
jgi:lipopolysaccharide export system permease protein